MTRVYVAGLGAFTPVGVNVPQTMGSLLARLQWFDDLEIIGAAGEPVSGARVRLSAVENAAERYVAMARLALAECHADGRAGRPSLGPVPLLLATSSERDLPCAPELLLQEILDADDETADETAEAGAVPRLDRRASRVFAQGKVGALRALAAAQETIVSGRARACYVGGVDSLLDPVRLNELLEDRRLLDGAGTDGVVPGEASVFLRLEARPASGGVVLGSALTDGPARVDGGAAAAASGAALARAATQALRAAQLGASSLAALVHDGSSEEVTAEELAVAISCLPFDHAVPLRPWAPAFSVGETGAAAALLAVAMTSFFLREGIFGGPALVWLTSEASTRAALVIGPHGSQSPEARRG